MALTELGPIFVKFGQILSTRRDLIPADVADELTRLQDQVAPFPEAQAREAIERALGAPVARCSRRSTERRSLPRRSRRCTLRNAREGREVVVKVLRPQIRERIADDVALLRAIAIVGAAIPSERRQDSSARDRRRDRNAR